MPVKKYILLQHLQKRRCFSSSIYKLFTLVSSSCTWFSINKYLFKQNLLCWKFDDVLLRLEKKSENLMQINSRYFSKMQKQPARCVPRKRCSENMQQIYKRTPMPKRDFIEITLRHGRSPVILLHIFRTLFLWTPLAGRFWKWFYIIVKIKLRLHHEPENLDVNKACFAKSVDIPSMHEESRSEVVE